MTYDYIIQITIKGKGIIEWSKVREWCCQDGLVSIKENADQWRHIPLHAIEEIRTQELPAEDERF